MTIWDICIKRPIFTAMLVSAPLVLGLASYRRLGVDPLHLDDFATPTFQALHQLTRHLLSQDARLYACIQLQNQANLGALSAFEESVAEILELIQKKDADGLVGLLEGIKEGFGGGGG